MAGQKWLLSFRILWLLLVLLELHHIECLCPAKESQALLDLKGEDQSHALSSWRPDSDCCRGWAGVTCDASGTHVVALNLTTDLQLPSGHISESFCNLYELQFANISFVAPIDSNNTVSRLSPDGSPTTCIWNITRDKALSIALMETVPPWSTDLEQHSSSLLSINICDIVNSGNLTNRLDEIVGSDEEGLFPDCVLGMNKLQHLEQHPCRSRLSMQFKPGIVQARWDAEHRYGQQSRQQYGLGGETRRRERSQRYEQIERDEISWDEPGDELNIEYNVTGLSRRTLDSDYPFPVNYKT